MPASTDAQQQAAKTQEYQALVRKIADRVWEMWRRELRQTQERGRAGRRN